MHVAQGALTGSDVAYLALAQGEVDAGFLPRLLSATDIDTYPDIIAFPFWAQAFGPIYNVPEVLGSLVLTQFTLARIFSGVVKQWNDPLILASNLGSTLPNKPIEVVLQQEAFNFWQDFVVAIRTADPAVTVLPSKQPVWPTGSYAKFVTQSSVVGPSSYVLAHPYSITIALVGVAQKLGAYTAALNNNDGLILQPTFISIQSAMIAKAIDAVRDLSVTGTVQHAWTANLVSAPGAQAWPFVLATSLFIPKTYNRQGCRARSELGKFIRW
jgi:ABC-type phosphate transport system substrate-binding protein